MICFGPLDNINGGSSYYARDYIEALSEFYNVDFIQVIPKGLNTNIGNNNIFLKQKGPFALIEANIKLMLYYLKYIRKIQYNYIFIHTSFFFVYAFFLRILGIRIVYDTNTIDFEQARMLHGIKKLYYSIFGFITDIISYISARIITFVSIRDRDIFFKYFRKKACFIVPVHINEEYIKPRQYMDKSMLRKEMNIPDRFTCLFVGSYKNIQNKLAIDFLVDKVVDKVKDVNFIFLGSDIPCKINNIICPGYVHEIDDYFYASDLLVNPVLAGSGIKTKNLDALFHGIPVLTTYVGAQGIEDLIEKGIYICDLDKFTEKICDIKNNIDYYMQNINNNILNNYGIYNFRISVKKMLDYMNSIKY